MRDPALTVPELESDCVSCKFRGLRPRFAKVTSDEEVSSWFTRKSIDAHIRCSTRSRRSAATVRAASRFRHESDINAWPLDRSVTIIRPGASSGVSTHRQLRTAQMVSEAAMGSTRGCRTTVSIGGCARTHG